MLPELSTVDHIRLVLFGKADKQVCEQVLIELTENQ